jgi:hypothetical protein
MRAVTQREQPVRPLRIVGDDDAERRATMVKVERIELWSYLRVSAVLATAVSAAAFLAGVLVWVIASSFGALGWLEQLVADGLGESGWSVPAGAVMKVWGVISLMTGALVFTLSALMVIAFNNASAFVGPVKARVRGVPAVAPSRAR